MIIISRHVLWKVRNSFASEMVGLGSFRAPHTLFKLCKVTLAWRVVVETTVYWTVPDLHDMPTSQSSTFENFFLTDENDG